MFIEYNTKWEDEISHTSIGTVGAPYRHSETLIMPAAALRAGLGVQYRHGYCLIPGFRHVWGKA